MWFGLSNKKSSYFIRENCLEFHSVVRLLSLVCVGMEAADHVDVYTGAVVELMEMANFEHF